MSTTTMPGNTHERSRYHDNEKTHNRSQLRDRRRELRRNQAEGEAVLWERLRARRCAGYKFRRQHSIGTYVVDFYCAEKRLIIEVDGPIHRNLDQRAYDTERTADLRAAGFQVLRFTNDEVLERTEETMNRIERYLEP